MHSTVEKLILGWLVVVATAWACDSPLVHRTDGGTRTVCIFLLMNLKKFQIGPFIGLQFFYID
ncbi:MAG: hypothetical protein CVU65_06500 [Deltaproteobacteria bacterium HGW-Deltaproteobacteria-22]|nr:MAG: hypothetical protein CVU65_06500 [Deltaproteobacteria bacterium HGW-Deltaproteobacteria-22]